MVKVNTTNLSNIELWSTYFATIFVNVSLFDAVPDGQCCGFSWCAPEQMGSSDRLLHASQWKTLDLAMIQQSQSLQWSGHGSFKEDNLI